MPSRWPHNIAGFRDKARRRVPRPQFDWIEGGAEDEVTLAANRSAFDSVRLVPKVLRDVAERDLSTTLAGTTLRAPIVLAPAGQVGLVHPEGELAAVRAAQARGLLAVVSGHATYSVEEIAAAASEPGWFNIFPWRDRDTYGAMIDRAAAAGFTGLCLTCDTTTLPNRERDVASGWVAPPRLTANAHLYARRPRWVGNVLRHRRGTMRNFEAETPSLRRFVERSSISAQLAMLAINKSMDFDDLAWIRDRWDGPLAVKGAFSPIDARRLVDAGVDVMLLGNHGGRNLDGLAASLEQLPPVVEAVGDRMEIVLDGGVSRGTDIIKAIALGARAVSVGRAWVWGLAVGGTAGVEAAMATLETELDRAMTLLGASSVAELDASFVTKAGVPDLQVAPREQEPSL